MRITWFLCVVLLCLTWKLTSCNQYNVEQVFKTNGIVPDVVDVGPTESIEISYEKSQKKVEQGNELTPNEVKEAPTVSYDAASTSYYTLAMVDPDAPSRKNPTLRSIKHWLVVNIAGSSVTSGDTLTGYVGSGPPKGTGLHRYIFLLYKQPSKLKFDESDNANRKEFSIKDFASKHGLGNPIAGNFFQAQNQDSA